MTEKFSVEKLARWCVHWRWLLMWSWVALLPTKNMWNVPIILMAVAGLVMLATSWRAIWGARAARLMGLVFLCLWLPMLPALVTAADFDHSLMTAAKFLRLPLAGVFMVSVVSSRLNRRNLIFAIFGLQLFWCADALLQFALGQNFFGHPWRGHRITGLFYPKLHMVLVLAAFLPIYLEAVRRLATHRTTYWVLLIPVLLVLTLGGGRNAWIMASIGGVLYGAFVIVPTATRVVWRRVLVGIAAGAVVLGLMYQSIPMFERRVDNTLGLFGGDFQAMDIASARRMSLWRTALVMFEDNWLTGIGPRGFRHAFVDYAEPDGFWMRRESPGATHPHQLILEVGTETGVLGLIGYLVALGMLLSTFARAGPEARNRMMPWFVAFILAWFPLNSHMAFYGSYWSNVGWWLLCAYVGSRDETQP